MLNGPTISFVAPSQVKLLFIKETANFEKNLHSRKQVVENKTGNTTKELELQKHLNNGNRGWQGVENKTENAKQELDLRNHLHKGSRGWQREAEDYDQFMKFKRHKH